MNKKIVKLTAIAAVSFVALGISGPTWAEGCILPNEKYPISTDPDIFVDPYEAPPITTYIAPRESIPAPSISEFDGSLTCASTTGLWGGSIPNGVTPPEGTTFSSGDKQFTVKSTIIGGKAVWRIVEGERLPGVNTILRGIDSTISASNKGAKGCKTTFGVDAGSGESAYEKSNGTLVASDLYVCASDVVDSVPGPPAPPVAEVDSCFIAGGGQAVIHDIVIQCPILGPGERRSIYIAKDTIGVQNSAGLIEPQPFPGFGFTDETGVIDFNNVCICEGPIVGVIETECNPDPVNPNGLPLCTTNDAFPSLNVEIQNPRCITYAGSRRCY